MAGGFIFGGDTGVQSAEELARRRKLVDALLETGDVMPRTFGEGLTVFGRAIAGKLQDKKLSAKEDAERARVLAEYNGLPGVSGGGGSGGGYSPSGTWTPAPPPPKPTESFMGKQDVTSGGLSYGLPAADTGVATGGLDYGANVMTPQEMLIAGATSRGLDPIDVATAISYETGGKFDPLMKGPTTQWGSHEGLIQFGDPQGQEHGAVFDQGANAAWRSQLDPTNGAVWSYLDSVGVKPGMGLDQIYSGINAGGVNRGGASDANNGGAPGTVSDKVAGMGPHREKAAAFLGGTWTPADGVTASAANGAAPAMGSNLAQLSEMASNPYLPEGQRAVVAALLEAEMAKMQPVDPMDALALEKAQLEVDAMKNPVIKPVDMPSSVQEYEYYAQGASARGETPMPYEAWMVADEKAANPAAGTFVQPVTLGQEAVDKAYAPEYVEWTQGGGADMASQIATVESIADRLESGTENLSGPAVGSQPDWLGTWLTPDAISAREDVESVVQRNLRILLGAQFTQAEGDRLIARAYNPKLPEAENAKRLRRLTVAMKAAADARQSQADYYDQNGTLTGWKGKVYSPDDFAAAIEGKGPAAAPPPPASPPVADADGWTTLPNGIKVRVKQ